jgi:ribose transport system permease protein
VSAGAAPIAGPRDPIARLTGGRIPWGWRRYRYAALAYGLVLVLLVTNVAVSDDFFSEAVLVPLIAGAAPLVILTIAMTIAMLSGNGGIDISVGPLAGLVNVVIIAGVSEGTLSSSPAVILPVSLGMGLLSGLAIGALVAYGRIQPIVVTLGVYLIYTALAQIVFSGHSGQAPGWLADLGDRVGPVPGGLIFIGAVVAIWFGLSRLPFHRHLYAVGDNDVAAYTAGVPVSVVRTAAYVIAGLFAAIAGLAVTALIAAGDSALGPSLTLTALAGAAIGGTSLAGGRGGVLGGLAGGLAVYLVQNVLSLLGVDSFWVTFSFGAILVIGIALNGILTGGLNRRRLA